MANNGGGIVAKLEAISRTRALTDDESRQLEAAIRKQQPKAARWHWSPFDDAKVLAVMQRRDANPRRKPFERDDDVRQLARDLKRTRWAVYRRMERLRKYKTRLP